ncbi:MAG: ECF transporter S component [Oscillospiraceae bacterium]|nr:ECF transporter S component [Oscillospiraceae bacterium]
MTGNLNSTKKLAGIAVFSAIIITLQLIATFVKFGPFEITLALVPIVVGAAVYGMGAGAFLGGVFGAVTLIAGIFGWSPGTNILWTMNPLLTTVLAVGKGAAAGFFAGAVYIAAAKKHAALASVLAAIMCPVANTGVFLVGMILFYKDTLTEWAGGTLTLSAVMFTILGVNFLLEFGVNVVLSPVVSRILKIRANFK